jgi:uncharacterized membrane protein YedE/YeeE
MDPNQIATLSGLVIGLLSGFCMMSSLRGWWAEGDGRLVRTYALAMGIAIAASQLLAARGAVDLGKSIYLQQSFSAPVLFFGGLLFGYGQVLANGCGSRALVLLGKGNLRSFVVVIVLGIFAEMTLKGLIAPARIAAVQVTQFAPKILSLPALLSSFGLNEVYGRMFSTSLVSAALIIFAFSHGRFRRSFGQIAAGIAVGFLIAAGWYATGHLGRRPAICHAVDGLDAQFRHCYGRRRVRGQPDHGRADRTFRARRLPLAAAHAAFGRGRRADGHRRRDGVRLLDRAGADGHLDAGAGVVRRGCRHSCGQRDRPARCVQGNAIAGGVDGASDCPP